MKQAPQAKKSEEVASRLIRTGIRLFGEKGTAVSLREVQRKARVLNEAAIRYYFGRRDNFIEACVRDVAERFEHFTSEAWQDFADKKARRPVEVRDISTVLVKSLYFFLLDDRESVWFMARLIREEGELGQDLLIRYFGSLIWGLEEEIREVIPDKPAAMVRLHLFLAINSSLNGMVDQGLLWRLPDLNGKANSFQLDFDAFSKGFIAYISAGIEADWS
ncbi:hypothetical protein [Alcanivorax sp.]|uniref:hypothetical protein n=1 Tax=Alcanivorax sp. TaxID=1872427 RepID=UPI0025BF5C17|nr:hypothetical protein [Alcanivorax sp.]